MSARARQTGRRLLAKQDLPPEVERAVREMFGDFIDAVDPIRQELVDAIQAGNIDPSSTTSVRAGVERISGNYTNDVQAVYRSGTRSGAEAGRAFAVSRHQLDVSFDVVPESVLQEFSNWSDEIVEEEVMETITDESTRFVRRAHEDGTGIDDLADRINDELFDGRLKDSVAEANARTATNSSANAGIDSAYKEAPGVVGERWITNIDGRERDHHQEADGQIILPDNTFVVGGEELRYPGDPMGSAENIIRCRCTTVPVFQDELTDDEFAQLQARGRIRVGA